MNRERLIAHFKFEEECDLTRHLVQDEPHIGWGRCLSKKGLTDAELEALGYEDEDDIQEITQAHADFLFENDIADAIADAEAVCEKYWHTLTPLRQEVLISMAYNAGRTGLRLFRRMHAALLSGDYKEAAVQMLDSDVARYQAPARYKRMAAAMETNDEAKLELTTLYDLPTANPGVTTSRNNELSRFSGEALLQELILREAKKK